jgi:hypothetical protein
LVAMGGHPDFRKDLPGCEKSDFLACEQLRNAEDPGAAPSPDERIRAAVMVDPEGYQGPDSVVELGPKAFPELRLGVLCSWPSVPVANIARVSLGLEWHPFLVPAAVLRSNAKGLSKTLR